MNAYIDASVLLRLLFSENDALAEWKTIKLGFSSRLIKLEIERVIDRQRLIGKIDDAEVVSIHRECARVLQALRIVPITELILANAGAAMPTVLGSLDSIHLATALEVERALGSKPTLATHDKQLAASAIARGFTVIG